MPEKETVFKVVRVLDDDSEVSVAASGPWRRTYRSEIGRRYWVGDSFAFRTRKDAEEFYWGGPNIVIREAEAVGVRRCLYGLNIEGMTNAELVSYDVIEWARKAAGGFGAFLSSLRAGTAIDYKDAFQLTVPRRTVVCDRLRIKEDRDDKG